jgi:GNAT superfamily N-acetyltransferase
MSRPHSTIAVRPATEADLNDVADMVQHFVAGHPAENHPRPLERLRDAYFGAQPVAHLLVATRGDRVVGMGQWTLIYDMFWSMFGGEIGWLYVRPESRGLGIPLALVAEICRQVRLAGGEHLHGGAEPDETASLYKRLAVGWPSHTVYLSAEAFQVCADLAGRPPREIVRNLPDPNLNFAAARPRTG